MRTWVLAAGVAVLAAGPAAGQPAGKSGRGPGGAYGRAEFGTQQDTWQRFIESDETHRWIVRVAYDASRHGTNLYRQGRHDESYRHYAAALFTLLPFLDREDLRLRIQVTLFQAQEQDWPAAAVQLRAALNDVRNRYDFQRDEAGKPVLGANRQRLERPLFERLGGREAVQSVVKTAYEKAWAKDSGVNLDRDGEYPNVGDRSARMQKLTVDLIEKLSAVQDAKARAAGTDRAVLGRVRAALQADLNAATKELAAAADDAKRKEAQAKVVDLRQQIDALDRLPARQPDPPAAPAKPPAADPAELKAAREGVKKAQEKALEELAANPASADLPKRLVALQQQLAALDKLIAGFGAPAADPFDADLARMRAVHRGMKVTDEEFAAALQVFRDALVLHAIPDQEIDELIQAVGYLRAAVVHDPDPAGR